MPEKRTLQRARKDAAQGKSANTQAGEFVREEMHHIREGKHGARSTKQAIAIGLSKARRAGVKMPPPRNANAETTKKAAQDEALASGAPGKARGRRSARKPSRARSRATTRALQREGHAAASSRAIGRQAHSAAMRRTPQERSQSAKKAARTRKHERAAT